MALEEEEPAVARLIEGLRAAERELARLSPPDMSPRIGPDAGGEGRVYLDHSMDIGAYNPCFPEYAIEVSGSLAHGTVAFPLTFEGPPGIVHGGFLSLFFDVIVQHHNCEVGTSGKTVSITVQYHRPTPLAQTLGFDVERTLVDSRLRSRARLFAGDRTYCTAEVVAVAGDRSALPEVSPRRARKRMNE
jgi:hypothetical protein